jgi:hypothetical protein
MTDMNAHSPPTEQEHFDRARDYQEYYDNSLREVGVRAPPPKLGQTVNDYRRETLHALQKALLQKHPEYSKTEFRELRNDSLAVFEPQALQACVLERKNPANIPPGEIKPIKVFDEYGRLKYTEFYGGRLPNGEQTCFTQEWTRPGRRVVNFFRPAVQPMLARREIG